MLTHEEILGELGVPHAPGLPDYPALVADLAVHKQAALVVGDQALAKHIWCLEHTVEIHQNHIKAHGQLASGNYFGAWCTLEQAELGLRRLRRHFHEHWEACRLAFIDKVTTALQGLYPYRLFTSPELLEESKSCTICGKKISIRNPCGHEVGEVYNGELCGRNVDKFQFLGLAMVRDPLQKYSVVFGVDPATGGRQDNYNYKTVEYLAKRWPAPFLDWDAEWTRQLHPKSKFGQIGRNDRCPCESGKKYKKCCMNLAGIMRPHVVITLHYPIPAELETMEFSY